MPAVSLIVHLEGGRERARRCLEALAGLADEPTFEAVIVDDASPDLGELLGGLSGDVKVLRRERRDGFLACAIAGAEAASSEVLVLLRDAPLLDAGRARRRWSRRWETPPAPGPPRSTRTAAPRERGRPRQMPPTRPLLRLAALFPTRRRRMRWRCAAIPRTPCAPPSVPPLTWSSRRSASSCHGEAASVSVPAALAAPARAAVAARRPPAKPAELTVVIPTLDATAPRVRACLAAIAANTPAPHQVVLVDNGSPPQGFAAPVNAGLRAVDTPYAVVMNDDVEVRRAGGSRSAPPSTPAPPSPSRRRSTE